MGYVPVRRYEEEHGTLSRSGLSLNLSTNIEDRWLFQNHWVLPSDNGSIRPNRDDDGCSLHISGDLIASDDQVTLEGLIVEITAQGLVTVAVFRNLEVAAKLRAAAGLPQSDQMSQAITWDMNEPH